MKMRWIVVAAALFASGAVLAVAAEQPEKSNMAGSSMDVRRFSGMFMSSMPVGTETEALDARQTLAGEVLVAFHPGAGRAEERERERLGASEIDRIPQIGVSVWKLPPGLGLA
jgi:hypothetical protein